MKIEQYISQLLYRHQCVTVPGFGAFLTEIQSARLQENTNSFYPPMKLISFNPHLKNNDGLLANHISQFEKISYDSAVNSIETEVNLWKKNLQDNSSFLIKNVGSLALNPEKNIVFTPSENLNYLTSSFGLNTFVSPAIKRAILEQEMIETEEHPTIEFVPENTKSRPYLKYAAILILALTAAGSIGYKIYDNRITEETLLVETAVQKQVQDKIQEATFFIENPIPAVTLTVKEEKLFYHIYAGAFRNETNAQNVYEELTRLGYHARRLEPNKHGLFPVLYGSFATKEEADKALIEIQQNDNPEAWLLIKEL